MTYVEDALSGIIIVVPDGDPLARERVLRPKPVEIPGRQFRRRVLISRLFPRKTSAGK
jgi:hypothetical protein